MGIISSDGPFPQGEQQEQQQEPKQEPQPLWRGSLTWVEWVLLITLLLLVIFLGWLVFTGDIPPVHF